MHNASKHHMKAGIERYFRDLEPGTVLDVGSKGRVAHYRALWEPLGWTYIGMDMVELNPTLDHANKTGRLAVWLILSALGKTIL